MTYYMSDVTFYTTWITMTFNIYSQSDFPPTHKGWHCHTMMTSSLEWISQENNIEWTANVWHLLEWFHMFSSLVPISELSFYTQPANHAWTNCGIWESNSREILLLEGNLNNFEGKFIIKMDICVFFWPKKIWKCVNNSHFWHKLWPYSRVILHLFQPWLLE